jgi:hypothetical protein
MRYYIEYLGNLIYAVNVGTPSQIRRDRSSYSDWGFSYTRIDYIRELPQLPDTYLALTRQLL